MIYAILANFKPSSIPSDTLAVIKTAIIAYRAFPIPKTRAPIPIINPSIMVRIAGTEGAFYTAELRMLTSQFLLWMRLKTPSLGQFLLMPLPQPMIEHIIKLQVIDGNNHHSDNIGQGTNCHIYHCSNP